MTLFHVVATTRRKAVWGPGRTLAAIVAALCLGFAPDALAAGRHTRPARKAAAGRPNGYATNYKIDGELTQRSNNPVNTLTNHKSKVIVELQRGATLPPPFSSDAK